MVIQNNWLGPIFIVLELGEVLTLIFFQYDS